LEHIWRPHIFGARMLLFIISYFSILLHWCISHSPPSLIQLKTVHNLSLI
jgi:hypothetical protein